MLQDLLERRFPDLAGAMASAEVADLVAACTAVELAAGEVLLTEGTVTGALWLVVEGALVVSVGEAADARRVGVIEAGGIVGEISLLDRGPASATSPGSPDPTGGVPVSSCQVRVPRSAAR